ncbi:hypothetical protein IAT38_000483 [Cryptococcus sp. DSM 104549]
MAIAPLSNAAKHQASKTVVLLGASYGGCEAAKILAEGLPANWRLIVVDRNTHFNHVYTFPRFSVLPRLSPRGFIPYKHLLDPQPSSTGSVTLSPELQAARSRHQFVQGLVTKLSAKEVTIIRPTESPAAAGQKAGGTSKKGEVVTYGKYDGPEEKINFDYLIYALGSTLPDPVNVWTPVEDVGAKGEAGKMGSKKHGLRFMERQSEKFKKSDRILIVGGGALGIQYAADLKDVYPEKKITLLHSRKRVMPIYPIELHEKIMEGLERLGVEVILGERVLTWPSDPDTYDGSTKFVTTDKGRTFEADLVLPCTGQKPHVSHMAEVDPALISPNTSRIRVLPTQQVHVGPLAPSTGAEAAAQLSELSRSPLPLAPSSAESNSGEANSDYSHIFAVGDVADTKAIHAGHVAGRMGGVAARNVLRLIDREEGGAKKDEELEAFVPPPPGIKMTMGVKNGLRSIAGKVTAHSEGQEDVKALVKWKMVNATGMDFDA